MKTDSAVSGAALIYTGRAQGQERRLPSSVTTLQTDLLFIALPLLVCSDCPIRPYRVSALSVYVPSFGGVQGTAE